MTRLADFVNVESGAGFPIADQGGAAAEFPFLKVSDMNLPGNEIEITRWNHSVSESVRERLRARAFPANTVIFPKIGAAIATNKKRLLTIPSCIDNNCMGVTGDPKRVDPRYLYYTFRTKNLSDFASDSNPPSIRKTAVESWDVPLPSLAEQQRIVDLLSRAENIIRMRWEAEQKAKEIIPALFLDMFGDPATNPKGHAIASLGDLFAQKPNYGTMIPAKIELLPWLCLRVANIQDGRLTLTDRKYVSLPDTLVTRHEVQAGDILMARAIGSLDHLGKCVVVNPGTEKWAFDSHLMRVRLQGIRAIPVWLQALLSSEGGRRLFLEKTRRTAVQFNINVGEMAAIRVPLPPIEQQSAFETQVQALHRFEAQQETASTLAAQAFRSLLAGVFGAGDGR